jgi:hypothetical protein
MDADGIYTRRLSAALADHTARSWLADGRRIVFVRIYQCRYLMRSDGRDGGSLTDAAAVRDSEPA